MEGIDVCVVLDGLMVPGSLSGAAKGSSSACQVLVSLVPEEDADGGRTERHAEAAEEVRDGLRVDRRWLGAAGDGREHGRANRLQQYDRRWRGGRREGLADHQRRAPLLDLEALLGGPSSGRRQDEVMRAACQRDASARGGQVNPLTVEQQSEAGLRAADGQGSRAGTGGASSPRTPPAQSPRRPPRPQPPRSPGRPRPRRSLPDVAAWSVARQSAAPPGRGG